MPVEFRADLHIHSCLSPCAELSMTPRWIVEKAASLGINIIALCDHNSAENVEVTGTIARAKGIVVIPGMEVTTAEEVHVIALFRDAGSALAMQSVVYEHLQPGENNEDAFGMQVVVNEENEVLGFNKRLLIGAVNLTLEEIVIRVHELGGLALASHIDREVFGIIGQLGFIPHGIAFDGLEISYRMDLAEAANLYQAYGSVPLITSSDAHRLEDIGRKTIGLFMNHATFDEISLTLKGVGGRRVVP